MLKISKDKSVILSLFLSVLFFIAAVVCSFILPHFIGVYVDMKNYASESCVINSAGETAIIIIAYLVIAVMMIADVFLFNLLLRVRKDLVFTPASVSLIRGVSWCCIFMGAVFAALGVYFSVAFALGFVSVFLGLCLRVVKNVIEQAVNIKNENDLTV